MANGTFCYLVLIIAVAEQHMVTFVKAIMTVREIHDNSGRSLAHIIN